MSIDNIFPLTFPHPQRKHQAMYDEFVKRKDMKREAYSSGSLHNFTTANGGSTHRYSHPIITTTTTGGGMGTGEGGGGGVGGGGVTKFDRHDPRQVCHRVCVSFYNPHHQ